ncbi:MAG TPA: glutathione synthetase [Flavobacteriaceae bacterium]|nr:glutathione synthetase [Flavobacteriaceae bacterium]
MKISICFILNDIATEKCGTSVYLMKKAFDRGHEVLAASVGDFSFVFDAPLSINCTYVAKTEKPETPQEYLKILQSKKAKNKKINSKKLDVLFLRNNPTEEESGRQWAEQSGVAFGRIMQQEEVLVLNDAYALSKAFIDKLYFEELPAIIKPASIITRNKKEILEFWEKQRMKMVLKPLEGSGGKNVFLVDKHEKNINQILDTIMEDGYVIAQEYMPDVKNGDLRVFLMNGKILEEDGKHAIIRRVSGKGEFRSNFKQGATADSDEMTEAIQRIVELSSPKLIKDGLFFVGLDIVKNKLIEINVLSPGGLDHFHEIGMPDFTTTVISSIEKKIEYKKLYAGQLANKTLATMS